MEGVRSLPRYFTCGFPIIPDLLVEEAIFDLLYCLLSSVKYHLTIFMRSISGFTKSVVYFSILSPTPHWCCSYIVSLEIMYHLSSNFVLFYIALAILGVLPLHINLKFSLSIPINDLLRFLLESQWIYWSSSEELTSGQYWVLSINMENTSMYFIHQRFVAFLVFCKYFIRCIPIYFSLGNDNINSIMISFFSW